LPCLGKAYSSHLLDPTAALGFFASLDFKNTGYFRIVIMPYIEQAKVLRYYGKKKLENKATVTENNHTKKSGFFLNFLMFY